MAIITFILALLMVLAGAGSIAAGFPIIQMERGWSLVIAGTVALSAGLLLFGLAAAIGALKRIERGITALASAQNFDEDAEAADFELESPALKAAIDPAPDFERSSPPPPDVVGTYTSGGNAYVMYADGSVQADTPTGRHRFGSLDELKRFVTAGGEAPPSPAA